jgi:hypothetical protein
MEISEIPKEEKDIKTSNLEKTSQKKDFELEL